mmetsp:Transcript_118616/g.236250  ORF Transcript_118616/g.236250 Transcript_118616/m.236250 type:complete len:123 (+) Transcript_118616:63-431(+)|eukprot:CAMPEP_0172711124 /NCGR_PEP_ID=MMETSP1074-20121228/58094_1 /TAXON_ID=2916 /ORGANISM="Ceratium fusus, Strain PA161109" /LENGTH=122 /DNA_ID=CAMNT_0013534709 /DNA_START=58 /DNA_END=426 /DNA_ORIENTATION=+
MAFTARRSPLPAAIVLTIGVVATWSFLATNNAFVVAPDNGPAAAQSAGVAVRGTSTVTEQKGLPLDVLALGVGAGLVEATPAQAYGIFYDELVPYASVTVFTIIWGIVLGFVLLRLQEAFPE